MSYLLLSRIKLLDYRTFSDCTCIETVSFYFEYCTEDGGISGSENRFIIEADIETGYRPESDVENDMRRMFSQYPIVNIEKLLTAFKYRQFYKNIDNDRGNNRRYSRFSF